MAKTVQPGTITIPGIGEFAANALPDPFDARDLEYRPRLQPLPAVLDQRQGGRERYVMTQDGNSCTGHALAAVINTVLARSEAVGKNGAVAYPHVSPYMLYRLARRYDEFEGDIDVGSSLRGAFKGWFNHGVLLEADWPALNQYPEPDLGDQDVVAKTRERPLGAFYRVNPYHLDDMQSAISELNAICVSAVIHEGWVKPVELIRNGEAMHVIARRVDARPLGGHAFALVGYNEVGFLVQNSWGSAWGKGGFATLPYEEWLKSAYDAWVARPGVPQTPFASGWSTTVTATGGDLVTGPAPDLQRLAMHVVNLGNQGRLSANGKFASSPTQIDRAFEHMDRWHQLWLERDPSMKRHVLLYAHGGLNSEEQGLSVAQQNVNWWLNNKIYPVFFAWQSGLSETLLNQLADSTRGRLPFGLDVREWLLEGVDLGVELIARRSFRGIWEEMKENAHAASEPIRDPGKVSWSPTSPEAETAMMDMPGASLTVLRLRDYVQQHEPDKVAVHLVGHSAGAIFHAALLQRLVDARIPVASLALLAPAIRVDKFTRDVLPHLGRQDRVRSFATFALTDQRELDDVCRAGGVEFYHKSLLYLVSRALEGSTADSEDPLLGMEKFFGGPLDGQQGLTLEQAIRQRGGASIFSRSLAPDDSRSDAPSHGGFASDWLTMTSVVMRALGLTSPRPENDYHPHAPLTDADSVPIMGRRRPPAPVMAEVPAPGERRLAETAETPSELPVALEQPGIRIEIAVAPHSGSPVLDILLARGWRLADRSLDDGKTGKKSAKKTAKKSAKT
ncbi:MAG: hypothetical protein ACRDTH_01035 [Pseudonocardiaceae bacterium]